MYRYLCYIRFIGGIWQNQEVRSKKLIENVKRRKVMNYFCSTWQRQSFQYSVEEQMEVENSEQRNKELVTSPNAITDITNEEGDSVFPNVGN